MLVIVKGRPIEIDWYIFKGANKQAEDFSQLDAGSIKVFLIGPSNKGDDQISRFNRFTYEVNVATDDNNKQYLKIDIDDTASALLDTGIYDIKVVWVKNSELHLGIREGNQHLSESRLSGIFAITADSSEDNTRLDSGVTAKKILRSFVEPTGYDGLSAYEIAVMHGYTEDEQTWAEEFTEAEERVDYEMDETKAGDGSTTRDDEKHIPVEEWVHESWAHKVEVTWQGNESTRQSNESTRQDNEDTRKSNEGIGTTDAECAAGSRRKNESIRVSNESTRQSQEGTRQDNETTRGQKETARQKAEGQLGDTDPDYATSRVKKELDRQSAESTRISNEEGRVAAEGSVEGQTGRAYAESVRVSNESTRQSNEGSRGTAETARQKAEGQLGNTDPDYATSRIKQELDRQTAEAARELAETARENAKISSTTIEYAVGDSGTTAPISGWQSTIPSYTTGDFLWGRTTITFGDGTSKVLYAIGSVPNVSVSQNASTGKTTITVGSDSYDVATEPVSVSQNTQTGGYDISIGNELIASVASSDITTPSQNLFNPNASGIVMGKGRYGDNWYTGDWNTTDLIPCSPSTQYIISNNGEVAYSRWTTYFDENKNVLSYINTASDFTTPSNAYYFCCAIPTESWVDLQIEQGNTITAYTPFGAFVKGEKIKPKTVSNDALIGCGVGRNMININDAGVLLSYYVAGSTVQYSQDYNTTAYIPVKGDTRYAFSCYGEAITARFVTYYDSNKTVLSYESSLGYFTTGATVAYIRASIPKENWKFAQMNEGFALPYRKYNNEIFAGVENQHENFAGFRAKYSSVLNGETKYFALSHIAKNYRLSAVVDGAISEVQLGVGENSYMGYFIKVTSSDIEVWANEGSLAKIATYEHGLTLGEKTYIAINATDESEAEIVLCSMGNQFNVTTYWDGRGRAFFTNNTLTDVAVECAFLPSDILKATWVFGDSYYGYNGSSRFPYYLYAEGYKDWLLNNLGGIASGSSFEDLKSLLSTGFSPKYLVWGLGMNDTPDVDEDTPDATWLTYVEAVIELCESRNIVPILCTIPSALAENVTPNVLYYHEAKSKWVRNSGYRFIDFAKAVGAQPDGTWYEGCKATDIHPSEKGAKMMAQQAMIDFPEITAKS